MTLTELEQKHKALIKEMRAALADYMYAEGCSCCRDIDAHAEAATRLGKLLKIKKYSDNSGYDFYSYKTKSK